MNIFLNFWRVVGEFVCKSYGFSNCAYKLGGSKHRNILAQVSEYTGMPNKPVKIRNKSLDYCRIKMMLVTNVLFQFANTAR